MSKKSFKVTPTTDFISGGAVEVTAKESESAPERLDIDITAPEEVENAPIIEIERTKEVQSKRLQITLKPSLYARLKAYADNNYMSVNGAVTMAIANLVIKGDKK